MKKQLILATALMLATTAYTQTEVTIGVMKGKEYGVTYMLPKTEIEITLLTTCHTYTPGKYSKYADRYLHLSDLPLEATEFWTLDRVEVKSKGVPDKENVYFVKLKDKTVAPLMELTEEGIIRSINLPFSGTKPDERSNTPTSSPQEEADPNRFMTEEMLLANSSAKIAELVAKEIYSIRESRNALLRGEADNMPKDGAQLKLMLDNLNEQEQALFSLFAGKEKQIKKEVVIHMTPEEMEGKTAFRFSRYEGVVDADNLVGEPYYIHISDLHTPNVTNDAMDEKKKLEGIVYNVPGRARVQLTHEEVTLFDGELPVTQFGSQEYLSPVLFNKTSTIKVLFDIHTGRLLKVDRE